MKIKCSKCQNEKDCSEFYKDSRKKAGYRTVCKKCFGELYPFKVTSQTRQNWRNYKKTEKGTITCLLGNASKRARSKGIEFSLDREWLESKLNHGVCEISGIQFDLTDTSKNFRARPYSPSIDKINAKGGYTKENCRVICFCVNMALSDWGLDNLYFMCEKVLKNRKL
jgi:hypothetical protein